MTDIQKLKELAQRAKPGEEWFNVPTLCNDLICETAEAEFIATCSPDVILGLIARLEAHEAFIEECANDGDDCVSPGFKKAARACLTAAHKP